MRNRYHLSVIRKPASYKARVNWSLCEQPRGGAAICRVFDTKAQALAYARMLRRKPAVSPWHMLTVDWFPHGSDPRVTVTSVSPITDYRHGKGGNTLSAR